MTWWTAERTRVLVRLYEAKLGDSVIAERLTEMFGDKVSRCKVTGKLQRLGLPTNNPPRKALNRKRVLTPPSQAPVLRPAPAHPPQSFLDEPHTVPLPLVLRKRHQCGWPVNDGGPFLFCALPKAPGDPHYCDFHRKLSQPTERGRRLMLNRRFTA